MIPFNFIGNSLNEKVFVLESYGISIISVCPKETVILNNKNQGNIELELVMCRSDWSKNIHAFQVEYPF